MHLLAILLLALVTPAAAKGSAGSGGGRGDGGGGGGTSSAGSGGTRTSSSSSSSSSGYHIYQPSGSLYSGSTAYRAYPVSSVAFVAVYGPGSHYYYYASPHYTGGTVENCTMVCLCNATNATNASSTAAAASPSSSTLQASSVTDPTTFFTRVLPLVADNNTDFDDFNSTVYDASNQTFFASDCTITTYGSGTSSAAALPPRSTVFMLVSALLAWWFMTALLG